MALARPWHIFLLPFPLLQTPKVGRPTRGVEELDTATSHALDSGCGVAHPPDVNCSPCVLLCLFPELTCKESPGIMPRGEEVKRPAQRGIHAVGTWSAGFQTTARIFAPTMLRSRPREGQRARGISKDPHRGPANDVP